MKIRNTKPAPPPAESTPGGDATGPGKNLRILLVEDHEDTRRAMERLLRQWGHAVHGAGNVAHALELDSANAFDLLLSDLELPDGTGTELLKKLRARHPLRAVAMSGHGTESDMARTREAGFDDHLIKPVAMDQLKEILQRSGGL
jgi:two-component system, chemotaxis family, CheB/CheR fusion protein